MNEEIQTTAGIVEAMELMNKNEAELKNFLDRYELPGRVNKEEKKKLVSRPRRIPIVTENITEAEGFYYNEPTLGDVMAMVNEIGSITGTEDHTINICLLSEYIVRHNSNVLIDAQSRSSDYEEIRAFVMRSLQQHFFSLLTYKDVLKDMAGRESNGSTEASVS